MCELNHCAIWRWQQSIAFSVQLQQIDYNQHRHKYHRWRHEIMNQSEWIFYTTEAKSIITISGILVCVRALRAPHAPAHKQWAQTDIVCSCVQDLSGSLQWSILNTSQAHTQTDLVRLKSNQMCNPIIWAASPRWPVVGPIASLSLPRRIIAAVARGPPAANWRERFKMSRSLSPGPVVWPIYPR